MIEVAESYDPWLDGEWGYVRHGGMDIQCCDCGLVHSLKFKIKKSANEIGFAFKSNGTLEQLLPSAGLLGSQKRRTEVKKGKDRPDPFLVKGDIPNGLAYQWVAMSGRTDDLQEARTKEFATYGWKPVPAKRHPTMRHKGNRIVIGNMLLMQKPKDLVDAELERIRKEAEENGKLPAESPVTGLGSTTPLSLIDVTLRDAKKTYRHAWLGYVAPVEVEFGYVMTESELETAVYLNLSIEEYARRRFLQLTGPHTITDEGEGIFRIIKVET